MTQQFHSSTCDPLQQQQQTKPPPSSQLSCRTRHSSQHQQNHHLSRSSGAEPFQRKQPQYSTAASGLAIVSLARWTTRMCRGPVAAAAPHFQQQQHCHDESVQHHESIAIATRTASRTTTTAKHMGQNVGATTSPPKMSIVVLLRPVAKVWMQTLWGR